MKKYFSLANFRKKTMGFLRDNEGASAIEYAIIAGLIAVAIIGAARLVGEDISSVFTAISTELETVADDTTDPNDPNG